MSSKFNNEIVYFYHPCFDLSNKVNLDEKDIYGDHGDLSSLVSNLKILSTKTLEYQKCL